MSVLLRNSGGASQEVVSVNRSRKCKEIDISIHVIVPLHTSYMYIVNRIPKEQGKGIIQITTESKDNAKST
jgi:hypothetical protein